LESLTVVLEKPERWWVARIVERPEVLSQGLTVPSALRNLADAAAMMEADDQTTEATKEDDE
jgi:predicted RNase H-like HicB family nuclease